MEDRLTVVSDRGDSLGPYVRLAHDRASAFREKLSDGVVDGSKLAQRRRRRGYQVVNAPVQVCGIWRGSRRGQQQATVALELREHGVDAVDARAGNHSDVELAHRTACMRIARAPARVGRGTLSSRAALIRSGRRQRGAIAIELPPQCRRLHTEIILVLTRDRLGRRQRNGSRIAVDAIHAVLVVQMRPRCEPRLADIGDDLALANAAAYARVSEAGQVSIQVVTLPPCCSTITLP